MKLKQAFSIEGASPAASRAAQTLAGLLAVTFILLTPLSTLTVRAQSGGSTLIHIVAWGETLSAIATRYGVSADALLSANNISQPDRIYAGQRLIIPGVAGTAAPATSTGSHVVQPGENLFRIGLRYGVSAEALAAANQIVGDQVYAGQTLVIPPAGDPVAAAAQAASPAAGGGTHTVQPGETLFSIARRYDVSTSALATLNSLLNPSTIYAGQVLAIPGAATSNAAGYTPATTVSTHVVQRGETLTSIAARYGTSAWVLAQVNNIGNPSLLYAGQTLAIPAGDALGTAQPAAPAPAKSIVVDVSDQRTYVYENGQLKWTFVVSTGMPGSDTIRGNYQIQNKIPNAYAATWDLQMPLWLGFYWAGPLQNGFHALPILSNGVRLWEGLLGRPASYGCVILSDHDARLLYDWADIGTPVTVRD